MSFTHRLKKEWDELTERSGRLCIFMHESDVYKYMEEPDKTLLILQLEYMEQYARILEERADRLGVIL